MSIIFSKPQKQLGVQMIRIKLPFGRLNPSQLHSIAEVSKKYSNGIMHTTTRQDIQLHYIESNQVEKLWTQLELMDVDGRETFGNTVRNITASPTAGVDQYEAFDVTPYAKAVDNYFRKGEINNDLGRKVKIAFSANEKDSAYTFMNDIGFIPTLSGSNKGFKVFIGGGMAGQSMKAKYASEFLIESDLILFIEAVLKVFAQNGELLNRNKARLKFLIDLIGMEKFLDEVKLEMTQMGSRKYELEVEPIKAPKTPKFDSEQVKIVSSEYQKWLKTNTSEQKQEGFYLVNIRLSNGDITSEQAMKLSEIALVFSSDDIRVTPNQGIQLKFVLEENLVAIYSELLKADLAAPGFNSAIDVTACPGTDTCNLGIANTTTLCRKIENLIESNFEDLIYNHDLKIKISGCMNACGHHTVAGIGLQATTIKFENSVYPGMHILLGGGILNDGTSSIAEKVMVVPSKRIPDALSILLHDFNNNAYQGEYFNDYYCRRGKTYFIQILLDVSRVLNKENGVDWNSESNFEIHRPLKMEGNDDLTQTLNLQIREKQEIINQCVKLGALEDALFHSYMVFVRVAKIKLLSDDIQCGTQMKILEEFENKYQNILPKEIIGYKNYAISYKNMKPSSIEATGFISNALNIQNIIKLD